MPHINENIVHLLDWPLQSEDFIRELQLYIHYRSENDGHKTPYQPL